MIYDPLLAAERQPQRVVFMEVSTIAAMVMVFLLTTLSSGLICFWLLRYLPIHQHYTADLAVEKVQAFHFEPTPRVGGLALFLALFLACGFSYAFEMDLAEAKIYLLLITIAVLPAFFGGLMEDVTKNVGVAQRLLLTLISTAIAANLIDSGFTINRVDVTWIDNLLTIEFISLLLTLFAVGGFTNAINLIDGYNGLAAGVLLISMSAIAIAAFQINDAIIVFISLGLMGALLGFLFWNWPRGQIFLGDGGAYLIGFISAEICMLLLNRNPTISPWFPLAIFIYPVFETLFTIYRRTFVHKTLNTLPDANHLHQLVFKYLVNKGRHLPCINQEENSKLIDLLCPYTNSCTTKMRIRNNRVAPYLWGATLINAALALAFMDSTVLLMGLCLVSCFIYVLVYSKLNKQCVH